MIVRQSLARLCSASAVSVSQSLGRVPALQRRYLWPLGASLRTSRHDYDNTGDRKLLQNRIQSSKALQIPQSHHSSLASILVSKTSPGIQPYLRLSRMDKPIGSWLLFWPCGWSACLASPAGHLPDLQLIALFGLGSFVMRGAGCTINDMWDRNIDRLVDRTRDRPITSGQVGLFDALVYTGLQLSLGLLVLLQLNWYTVLLGSASMGLVVSYPLMKRFTYYPQFVLGLAFNWGALVGWSAVRGEADWEVVLPLYLAGISWTMIYDTIYAHQDKYDDVILGVKSTAIKFGEQTPVCLSCFATFMTGCLAYCGWTTGQTWPYYLSILGVASHLTYQIKTLNIHDAEDCAKKFRSNRFVGLIICLGLMMGNLNKTEDCKPIHVQDIVEEASRVVDNEKILAGGA